MTLRYAKKLFLWAAQGQSEAADILEAELGKMVFTCCLRSLHYSDLAAVCTARVFGTEFPEGKQKTDPRHYFLLLAKQLSAEMREEKIRTLGSDFWKNEAPDNAEDLLEMLDTEDEITGDILLLRYGAGMDFRKISRSLKMTEGAVSWRCRAALERLGAGAEERIVSLLTGESPPEFSRWKPKRAPEEWLPYAFAGFVSVAATVCSVVLALAK